MPIYTKKPETVDAVQFDPTKKPWPPGVFEVYGRYYFMTVAGLLIVEEIAFGDWIIQDAAGNRNTVRDETFKAKYQ